MRFVKLSFEGLAGVRDRFEIAFGGRRDPDVVVVTGRNASGKTSILRAVRGLIEEDDAQTRAAVVTADVETVSGAGAARRVGGRIVSRPAGWPGARTADYYLVRHDELIRGDGGPEENVAREVYRLLAGGFDVSAARDAVTESIGGLLKGRTSRTVRGKLDEARQAYRAALTEHMEVERQRGELPDLERRLDEARRAAARKEAWSAALDALEEGARLEDLETRLAVFPGGMERLREEDASDLRALRAEERERRDRIADLERSIAETAWAADVDERRLDELSALARECERTAERRADARREFEKKTSAFRALLAQAGLESHAMPSAEALAGVREALDAWRRLRDAAQLSGGGIHPLGLRLVFATAAVSLFLSVGLLATGRIALGLGGLVVGLAALVGGLLLRGSGGEAARRAECGRAEEKARAALREAGLGEVSPGRAEGLLPVYERLLDARGGAAAAEEGARTAEAAFARAAERWKEAADGLPDVPDAALGVGLCAWVDALKDTRRAAVQARRDLDRERDLLRTTRERIAALFARTGVPEGDDEELRRRLDRLPDWKEWEEQRRDAAARREGALARLGADEEARALVESGDRAALEGRLREADEQARSAEDLIARIGKRKDRIQRLEQVHDLERTRAEVVGLEAELRRSEHLERVREAVKVLAEQACEAVEEEAPELLRRTAGLFRRITRRRWDLRVRHEEGGGPRFLAFDTSRPDAPRTLDELSTGTRLQLMLAARVAYLETIENGREPFPLFVDEALANADPERLDAAAAALVEIARHRQVIYLTAQPGDLAVFRRHAPDLQHLDLDELRGEAGAMDPSQTIPEPPPPPPSPGDGSPEEYARLLKVPGVDLHAPPEAIHVFHLFRDDLPRLHRWLRLGLETVGRVRAFLREDSPPPGEPDDLELRLRLAETFLDVARIGRPPPVDRRVLEESDAVTARYLDEILALAARFGGDAGRLVEALGSDPELRPRGFGDAKVRRLREALAERGLLVEETPLDLAQTLGRVAHRLGVEPDAEPWRALIAGLFAAAGLRDPP